MSVVQELGIQVSMRLCGTRQELNVERNPLKFTRNQVLQPFNFILIYIYNLHQEDLQGVPQLSFHFFLANLLASTYPKTKVGRVLKTSGNLLYDRHKNFEIDPETAELIEVKVATCNIKIIFLPHCNSKMSISK